MKKNKNIIVIFLILFISIGFAYLSTTLNIGGSVTFKENNFDIHFENIEVISEDVSYSTLEISNTAPTTINASINFKEPSEIFEYIVDVVNGGGIDALFQSIDNNLNASNQDYITIEIKYFDGTEINENDVLRMGQSKRIRVKVIYNYDIEKLPTIETTSITTTINYINVNVGDITYDRKVWNYDYTGYEQIFIVPKTGTYKLEVWGAQGGSLSQTIYGGYGGYSSGNIELSKTEIVYINIGGMGQTGLEENNIPGGYNGGGSTYYTGQQSEKMTSGGGATHIATESGLLSSLEQNKSSIIIVAGAGGGCYIEKLGESIGGHGGGYIGSTAEANTTRGIESSQSRRLKSTGGTQTSGGTFGYSYNSTMSGNISTLSDGTFGQGGYYDNSIVNFDTHISGGGSGYYGGGAGYLFGTSGGSGYIGNTSLTDKIMYCYECQDSSGETDETNIKTRSTTNVSEQPISNYAKIGNGYARITLIS